MNIYDITHTIPLPRLAPTETRSQAANVSLTAPTFSFKKFIPNFQRTAKFLRQTILS